MMKNEIRLFCILLCITVSNQVFSQDDIDKYFDDGGKSLATRMIKIGFDPWNGEFPVAFEQRIGKYMSIEVGGGLVSLKMQNIRYRLQPIPDLPASGLGYTAWINLRLYKTGLFERFYVGLQPKISIMDKRIYGDIVFCNMGYQLPISGNIHLELHTGLGVRIFKYTDYAGSFVWEENGSRFYIPLLFKVGYVFQ